MAVTVTNAKSSPSLVLKVKSCSWDVEEFTNIDGSITWDIQMPHKLEKAWDISRSLLPVCPLHPSDQNIGASSMSIHWQSPVLVYISICCNQLSY